MLFRTKMQSRYANAQFIIEKMVDTLNSGYMYYIQLEKKQQQWNLFNKFSMPY